jgi:hypothetical protein
MKKRGKTDPVPKASTEKRPYLSQAEVPGCSLENALRIPKAISENYGGGPPLRFSLPRH